MAGAAAPQPLPPLLQTALHFLVCSVSIWASQSLGMIKKTSMPFNGACDPGVCGRAGRHCTARHRAALSLSLPSDAIDVADAAPPPAALPH